MSRKKLFAAVRDSGVKRYVMVGGAASLFNVEGVKVWDTLQGVGIPEPVLANIAEGIRAFDLLQLEDSLDWTFFSPAVMIGPVKEQGSSVSVKIMSLLTKTAIARFPTMIMPLRWLMNWSKETTFGADLPSGTNAE